MSRPDRVVLADPSASTAPSPAPATAVSPAPSPAPATAVSPAPAITASEAVRSAVGTTAAVTLVATAGSAAARLLAARLPRAARASWGRTNHAGRPVTLLEGPAWIAGAVSGIAVGAVLDKRSEGRRATATSPAAALAVTVASGALGALDDLAGSSSSKGLRGHLGALRGGEVTTGAVKVAGLAATGLVGALITDRRRRRSDGAAASAVVKGPLDAAVTAVVGGAVLAGAANVSNLFDLRPGRALKVVMAAAGPLALTGNASAGAALGASAGVIGNDLAGVSMLGDTGANAAGALVGLALVERTGLRGRLVALGLLTALTLSSERISFTEVIEGNDLLRRLDEWGRARP